MVVCDLRQLLNFPEPQFPHLYNEGIESHVDLVTYSSHGDIHTLSWARPFFARLHAALHFHHGATWQTLRLSSDTLGQFSPTSVHTPHTIFQSVLTLCYHYLVRDHKMKGQGRQTWVWVWVVATHLTRSRNRLLVTGENA